MATELGQHSDPARRSRQRVEIVKPIFEFALKGRDFKIDLPAAGARPLARLDLPAAGARRWKIVSIFIFDFPSIVM